jgi:hypothetical protein
MGTSFRFLRGDFLAPHPWGQTTRPGVTNSLYANVRGSSPTVYETLTTSRGLSGRRTSDI